MPYTDIGNRSTFVPASPLQRHRPQEQPSPLRRQAFAQEGLRRRSALSAQGSPGNGGYRPLRQRAFGLDGMRRRAAMGIPQAPQAGLMNVPAGGVRDPRLQSNGTFQTVNIPSLDQTPAGPQYQNLPGRIGQPVPPGPLHTPLGGIPTAPLGSRSWVPQEPPSNPAPAYRSPLSQPSVPNPTLGGSFPLDFNVTDLTMPANPNKPAPEPRMLRRPLVLQQMDAKSRGMNEAAKSTYFRNDPNGQPITLPIDRGAMADRVGSALAGHAMPQVPLEQQGFVDQQNRFRNAPTPLTNSQDGILPGNPWYDNTPRERAPGNGYGLARIPQGALVDEQSARGVQNGPLARYGNSTLQRIGGRNVLVGNGASVPNGDVRAAVRAGQDKYAQSPQMQQIMANRQQKRAGFLAQQNALRQAAVNQRLARMGAPAMKPPEDTGMLAGYQPLGKQGMASVPVDVAVKRLSQNAAKDTWAMIGQPDANGEPFDITKGTPDQVVRNLDSDIYRGISDKEKRKISTDVENFIAINPGMDETKKEQLRQLAKGDRTASAVARNKRHNVIFGDVWSPPTP